MEREPSMTAMPWSGATELPALVPPTRDRPEKSALTVAVPPNLDRSADDAVAQRRWFRWTLFSCIALLAALAVPFFCGRVYVADDLGEFHLPVRDFYSRQLGRGQAFDWMPSLFCGFYLTGEGQVGGYHPLHLLLYRWLPLTTAFDLELLLSYPFMLAGTYLFLRRWTARSDAALFGAMVFTFSSFNLLHFVHPNGVAIVAHVPWLLLSIDVALTSKRPRQRAGAALCIGLLTASQLLLGYPQYVWLSLVAEMPYAAWRIAGLPQSRARALGLLGVKLLGLVAGGIQLLPTLDALMQSTRQASDAAFANSGSLHPLNVLQLIGPYLFQTRVVGQNTHELGLYLGAVPLLLCVWLMAQRAHWGSLKPVIRAALVAAVVAFVLACGEHGQVYRLQTYLPVVGRFRFPCRAIVLFQFAAAVLAASAFVLLARRCSTADRHASITRATWATVAVSALLAVLAPVVWQPYVASPELVWCGPVLLAAGALLILCAERGHGLAVSALVCFAAIDLGVYGISFSVYGRTAELKQYAAGAPAPPQLATGRVAAELTGADQRELTRQPRVGDRMLLAGVRRADGYAGLEPARRLDYRDRAVLRLAGVQWILDREPLRATDDATQTDHWIELPSPLPRAYLVTELVPMLAADNMNKLADGRAAQVDTMLALPPGQHGRVIMDGDEPGRVEMTTHGNSQQLLVLTESYHSGWRAAIDDRPADLLRVNGDFIGCSVPAGDHHVRVYFRPASLQLGIAASVIGLGLMLFFWILGVRNAVGRHRSMPREDSHASPAQSGAGQCSAAGLQRG